MADRDPLLQVPDRFGVIGWAGVIKVLRRPSWTDFTDPATMVFAQWQVPDVLPVHPAGGRDKVGFWVGLDGYEALHEPASKQVLQAGVAATLIDSHPWNPFGGTTVRWWAWTEWYSQAHKNEPANHALEVKNFTVAAGDTMFVVVCAPEPDFGFVSMLNITRGKGVSVGFNALSGILAQGASAEWIVEFPPQSPHMPIFSPVTFTDCTAGSLQHGIFHLTDGDPSDIVIPRSGFPYGYPVTKTTIASPTVAVVEELDVDWF